MTNNQYFQMVGEIELEIRKYTDFTLKNKSKDSIFDNAFEIYGIQSIYDYLTENGMNYNKNSIPPKNILKSLFEYLKENNFAISDYQLHDMLIQYAKDQSQIKYLIKGKLYEPILFGDEDDNWVGDEENPKCGDCGCEVGEQHLTCCDIERCPACGLQFISCDCGVKYTITKDMMKKLPKYIELQEQDNKELEIQINKLKSKWEKEAKKNQDSEM